MKINKKQTSSRALQLSLRDIPFHGIVDGSRARRLWGRSRDRRVEVVGSSLGRGSAIEVRSSSSEVEIMSSSFEVEVKSSSSEVGESARGRGLEG
ncbi:hypothetical protein CRG98_025883 [Punica granatum]|uniref:Uncharacterized protein n=1 Tax=Punica granatum TaxID=22663 RepID=A0A2I0JCL0_PUNGR|nr:hypothetical protein CRG98_025883 [Punica granatum]